MRRRTSILLTLVAVAVCSGLVSRVSTSADRVALTGSVPSWAARANLVGPAASSDTVVFRIYLPWQNGNAAAEYALAASTPGNALSGQFLSPTEFRSRFSPSRQDVSTVVAWLKDQGFSVGYTPANRHFIEAIGTVGQASAAFDTTFSMYRVGSVALRSPQKNLTVPSSLPAIAGVIGLDESAALIHVYASPAANPPPAFVNAPPCSTYWGEKTLQNTPAPDGTVLPPPVPPDWVPCGYAGAQLQGAYGMTSAIVNGNDGRGVTVAVIDAYASTTIVSDVEQYSALHGLPSIRGLFRQVVAPGTYRRPQNPRQDPEGWSGEETLDVEAVHTMAPGASIVYVGAPNNYQDLDSALNHVVDQHLADIVTNSYGFAGEALPPGYIKPYNDTLIQAAIEGITVLFSSGDSGDNTGGDSNATPSADFPASSPWVTAAGGTALGVDANNNRLFELGWETARSIFDKGTGEWGTLSFLYGSGGGTSRLFAQPSYQAGVVPDAISKRWGGAAMRAVPDVSADGEIQTGMLVGQTQTFPDGTVKYSEYRIGGTSLSSPLLAGMIALAVQLRDAPLGFANPKLYAAAGTSAYYDITKADLATYTGVVRNDFINSVDASDGYRYSKRLFDYDQVLTIHVRPGYDDVTGLGAPNGQAWLNALQ